MLRVAHLADSHFNERRRLDDTIDVHQAFIDQAREAGVDLILHAGDLFERRSSVRERRALADFLLAASEVAPVIGVRGNHDAPGEAEFFSRLRTHRIARITERPELITVGPFSVYTIPWASKLNVAAAAGEDATIGDTTEASIRATRELLDVARLALSEAAQGGQVPLVVAHAMVAGSELSTGQTLIGRSVELSPAELGDLGAAYVALGHIHKHQAWGNVVYAGSPERMNFGEPEPKGWVLVEIEDHEGGCVTTWGFRELPARQIERIDAEVTGDDWMPGEIDVERGSLVRYRYRCRPEHLHLVDEEAIAAALLGAGAADVKIEAVVVQETRARCAEIAAASDTWSKVRAYWQAKGIDVPESRADAVRGKLEELEAVTSEVTA